MGRIVGRWALGLGLLTGAGCSAEKAKPTTTQSLFERGEAADHRFRVCSDYILRGFSAEESLGILLAQSPEEVGPGVDCIMAAESCEELLGCEGAFEPASLTDFPQCDGPSSTRCDGDVLKRCTTNDDVSWHERSFDCTLADAHCEEGVRDEFPWVECVIESELCDGVGSYCDGSRAIVCREDGSTGLVNPAVFDCADVFESTCAEPYEGRVDCEGPAVGEVQCGDELDNDEDGEADCGDADCEGSDDCFEPETM